MLGPPRKHVVLPKLLQPGPAGGEDAPLDYLRSQDILSKLSETAEKSFLGSFKGAAGTWDKLVRAYEYGCEYAGGWRCSVKAALTAE